MAEIQKTNKTADTQTLDTLPPLSDACKENIQLNPYLQDFLDTYSDLIKYGQFFGLTQSVSNLKYFLNSTGESRTIDSEWLKRFDEVNEAEQTNAIRFEHTLFNAGVSLVEGTSTDIQLSYDRQILPYGMSDLLYASGGSTLHSDGNFHLSKKENVIIIAGAVNHSWSDLYNFDPGKTVFIPFFSEDKVSDRVGARLEYFSCAKKFKMQSEWNYQFTAKIELDEKGKPNRVRYIWTDRNFNSDNPVKKFPRIVSWKKDWFYPEYTPPPFPGPNKSNFMYRTYRYRPKQQ